MIKRLLCCLLCRNNAESKVEPHKEHCIQAPKAGDVWVNVQKDGSPWPKEEIRKVKVLDAKDGWVRYYIGEFFPDERMKVDMFTYIYKKQK